MKMGIFEKALVTNICTGIPIIVSFELLGFRLGPILSLLFGIFGQIGWDIVYRKIEHKV